MDRQEARFLYRHGELDEYLEQLPGSGYDPEVALSELEDAESELWSMNSVRRIFEMQHSDPPIPNREIAVEYAEYANEYFYQGYESDSKRQYYTRDDGSIFCLYLGDPAGCRDIVDISDFYLNESELSDADKKYVEERRARAEIQTKRLMDYRTKDVQRVGRVALMALDLIIAGIDLDKIDFQTTRYRGEDGYYYTPAKDAFNLLDDAEDYADALNKLDEKERQEEEERQEERNRSTPLAKREFSDAELKLQDRRKEELLARLAVIMAEVEQISIEVDYDMSIATHRFNTLRNKAKVIDRVVAFYEKQGTVPGMYEIKNDSRG